MNRGESYLLKGIYELAIEDFQNGYALAGFCNHEVKSGILLRALLGMIFSYGIMDKMEEFYLIEREIRSLINLMDCKCSAKKQSFHGSSFRPQFASISTKPEIPIYGPDRISIAECIERVEGIEESANLLISKSRLSVQVVLRALIRDLKNKAIRCCEAGGVWKSCIRPIAAKWYDWNQKYNALGIPPDPAWD